ncbi:MAG: sigma-70 family RNA polymerase sigma factor [Ruminococcaceae bacterium]|nr:sigma-70 family RNA polymerase sigma factor [Oscillospiraceae bacterium]
MFFQMLLQIISNVFYLALHVTNAGSFPAPLSAKREAELLVLEEQGDENAKNELIEHNLRLVAHVVKKYYTDDDQDDLISIGTIGLIKAINTFKSDKKIRLATYAARCIENEILMHFRGNKKYAQDVYISDPIDTDKNGNTLTLIDIIADDSNIEDEIDTKIKVQKLRQILGTTLDKRELEIIKMRYGLDGQKELTQREIAKKLKISRSYVSRIETAALEKLKNKF